VTAEVKEKLVDEGYNPSYGARPLRRAIQRLVEDPLAEDILSGAVRKEGVVEAYLDDGKVRFRNRDLVAATPPAAEESAG